MCVWQAGHLWTHSSTGFPEHVGCVLQGSLPLQALLQAAQAAPLLAQGQGGAVGAGQLLAPAWGTGAGGAMMQVRLRPSLSELVTAPAACVMLIGVYVSHTEVLFGVVTGHSMP